MASDYVTVHCSICGKTMKVLSSKFYSGDSKTLAKVKEARKACRKKEHVCSTCKKKEVFKKEFPTLDFTQDFKEVQEKSAILAIFEQELNLACEDLKDKIGDRIVKYKDKEYIVSNIMGNSSFNYNYRVTCRQINKVQPWKLTDQELQIYSNRVTPGSTQCNLKDVLFTDEHFNEREQRYNKNEDIQTFYC